MINDPDSYIFAKTTTTPDALSAKGRISSVFFSKNWVRISPFLAFLSITFFLTNCANPIAPTGGPKDETPPKLDTLHSTRNRQVRFEKQDIVLAFDEWVELKDAFNQVVISPPLEFRPTIERKKKTIQLKFDDREVLRDSATYVINFGEAIRDLTEGNVAPIVFVFSTGDYIDSLTIEGRIIDAYTLEPVKDVLFMLYENLADSVFRKERPFYFSKTDEQGNFKVNNIKAGYFKAAALADKNLNYRFDNEAELIAFLDTAVFIGEMVVSERDSFSLPVDSLQNDSLGIDSLVIDTFSIELPTSDSLIIDSLTVDSSRIDSIPPPQKITKKKQAPIVLKLFEEEKKLYLRDDETKNYGRVKLAFNRDPYDAVITYDSVGLFTHLEKQKDTLFLWYAMESDAPFNVFVQRDTSIDTVAVADGLRAKFYENAKLEAAEKAATRLPVLPPGSDFILPFNHPIFSIDENLIQLYEDSAKTEITGRFAIDSLELRKIRIDADWKEDTLYEVAFWPGAITDIFGLQNADTIRRKWMTGLEKDFGSLTLRVVDLRPDSAYIIRFLAKNDEVKRTFMVSDTSYFETQMPVLAPDTYSLEIIEDLDRNGRWTTGNYDLKRQPERVQKAKLEEVRANWEVDAEVGLNFTIPAAKPSVDKDSKGPRQPAGNGLRSPGGKE
ncbi:MAG: Ig-like domain-containing protein [Saprospiraceae bacterium]